VWQMFPGGASCPWTEDPGGDPDCVHNRELLSHIKMELGSCESADAKRSNPKSLAHRGTPAVAPEHTMAGYQLARSMGAAFIECDVAVTKDQILVCRHSMCDLQTTTDILKGGHDDLAAKCSQPFLPSSGPHPASATCCTYDFTLEELQQLCMTMDEVVNPGATVAANYTVGPPFWRSRYGVVESGTCEKIVKHRDMAAWLISVGAHAIPELKDTATEGTVKFLESVGSSAAGLANQLMAELQEVGFTQTMVNGSRGEGWSNPEGPKAIMQTFDREVAKYWKTLPGSLPVCYLYKNEGPCDPSDCGTGQAIQDLARAGVEIIGPPLFGAVTSHRHTMRPTLRAAMLTEMGFGIIPWSLERSGCPAGEVTGGEEHAGPCGWYYTRLAGESAFDYSDILLLLYSLIHEVNATGMFSDYPLTTTMMANCVSLFHSVELEGPSGPTGPTTGTASVTSGVIAEALGNTSPWRLTLGTASVTSGAIAEALGNTSPWRLTLLILLAMLVSACVHMYILTL